MIIDATITGEVPRPQYQDMLATLLGATVNVGMPKKTITQLKRMLVTHLMLLSEATTQHKPTPIECTHMSKANLDVATEDIQKGKIVVRIKCKQQIQYLNIRHLINALSTPEMHRYEIGLGIATTRTKKQQ